MVEPKLNEDRTDLQEKIFGAKINQGGSGDAGAILAQEFHFILEQLGPKGDLGYTGAPRRADRIEIFYLRQQHEWTGCPAYRFFADEFMRTNIFPNFREYLMSIGKQIVQLIANPHVQNQEVKEGRFQRLKRFRKG